MNTSDVEFQPEVKSFSITTFNVMRDQKTGEVTISGNGNADVDRGTYVKWNITGPGIKKIEIIPGSKGNMDHDEIWAEGPDPLGAKSWIGQVKDEKGQGYYSVIWFDVNNTPHVIDPLIRVNQ